MLAIIIPYFKLTFFDETLQSLANQTDQRFKVYIGDDASPEDCTPLLEKYRGKFDFTYHRFESNLGGVSLTQQWERCIALSGDEEWLMILGDDDVLGDTVVVEFYNFLDLHKAERVDLIRFCLQVIDKNDMFQKNEFLYQDYESEQKLLERIFSIKETITASEFIFSRNVYNQNNGFVDFPLAWFSDYATWLLYGKKSGIYNIKKASVYWRLSGINISSKSVDVLEVKLKVKSLFLFMSFLQMHFSIKKEKLKQYVYTHLTNLLRDLTFFHSMKILMVILFELKKNKILVIIGKFILKKLERKTSKIYEGICSASRN